jgi:hypothetical protein
MEGSRKINPLFVTCRNDIAALALPKRSGTKEMFCCESTTKALRSAPASPEKEKMFPSEVTKGARLAEAVPEVEDEEDVEAEDVEPALLADTGGDSDTVTLVVMLTLTLGLSLAEADAVGEGDTEDEACCVALSTVKSGMAKQNTLFRDASVPSNTKRAKPLERGLRM